MGLFDEEKYLTAASKALSFIKAQMDINNFTHKIIFAKEYGAYYYGDVMYGTIEGFSGGESMGPTSISCPFYDFDYKGTVGGTCSGEGVTVHLIHDNDYLVITCPSVDGSWQSQMLYKEIYTVIDYDELGQEIGTHEEEVEYYLPVEIGEGIKEFRLCTGLTSEWEILMQTGEVTTMRLVYHATGEIMPENGGGAYPYLTDYLFRLYTYSDAEYLNDECHIFYVDGKYMWYADYNGPQEIDHLFPMNREHGKINQRKREESILCHEGNTHRNLRPRSFWRYSRESGSWEPLLRRTT